MAEARILVKVCLVLGFVTLCISAKLSLKNSVIWGPGLNANFQMPTRYIFVQLVDENNKNVSTSAGKLDVGVSSANGERVAMSIKTYDRADGSYIINMRPYRPIKDLILSIKMNGKDIGRSPYTIPGYMYQENCDCPMPTADWLEAMQCPSTFDQLEEDLKPFTSLDMREVEKIIHKKFPKSPGQGALMHYVIKDNRVFRKDVGSITGFKMFSDSFFLTLTRKIRLPDVELFINLGDWPLVDQRGKLFPVVSWCGSTNAKDIILPTYDITDSVIRSVDGVTLDILSVQESTSPPWKQKIPKGLFRGRDSRQERLDLAKLARQGNNSELLDVGITAFFFFPKDESLEAERISFFDFFKYKYQINVDGTVAAYRFPYLLAGGSLVLKQDSEYFEHFYRYLKPWVHYVPLKHDLSDVLEKIQWAIDNDREARKIARNAQEYVRQALTPRDIMCYYYLFFKKYAERLKSAVNVLEGMEEAEKPTYHAECNCHRKHTGTHKDEL